MSLVNTLTKACTQIAVYWGSPEEDGYGTKTYADPIEIYCRWKEEDQMILDKNGDALLSRDEVHVLQDVDFQGLLYLGRLTDLDSDQEENPMTIENIGIIVKFEKIPLLKSTDQFLRKVYLKPWRT